MASRIPFLFAILAFFMSAGISAQPTIFQVAPNYFTNLSAVPHGCFPAYPAAYTWPDESVLHDESVTVNDRGLTASFRVRAWRARCHEPDRSAIIVNFDFLSGNELVRYPVVRLSTSTDTFSAGLYYDSDKVPLSGIGDSLNSQANQFFGFPDGVSYVVDGPIEWSIYNDSVTLELDWGNGQLLTYAIPDYDPASSPGFESASLHGRYSGSWIAQGLPNTGLILQVGEVPLERNYVFAVWFTYKDSRPFWVVGNKNIEMGVSQVNLDMLRFEGGSFVTDPGSYSSEDIESESIGTMTIRPIHCNALEVDLDFESGGFGNQTLELERLVRIAGYDCDQTQ